MAGKDNTKESKASRDKKAGTSHDVKTPNEVAAASLEQTFPGGFELVPTNGVGRQCGFHSMMNSADYENRVQTPTLENLQTILLTGPVQERLKGTGLMDQEAFDENYLEDLLAAVLEEYGDLV